ncbi:uncharacterized protein TNIN_463541 [Trichonephila inaurata madagascariensis]|uniref:Uncharacterized protein n=1 Tax=Trichonephila inaurata madagascariensis TaxID=2747483 RepID=A0A8X6YYP2_9ARAC|nr:uncharacterized protein TNIN_463541 [Trichonephila inaurata madagascariensis]
MRVIFLCYLAKPIQNHSMPAMVSQNQENAWENGPSRTGSMLSLDGRQRPPTAKTPPSYYDAVRSRHSLSQPVNKSPESMKQEKSLHVQQVKYNSLPRPLPQRYPPVASNGQPVRTAWAEDHYDPNRSNGSMHRPTTNDPCGGMRQQYDSPPKPANRVPLQLQVHQEKSGSLKRNHEQPEGSCPQGYMPSRSVNTPRQSTERLTIDCSQRGSGMVSEFNKHCMAVLRSYLLSRLRLIRLSYALWVVNGPLMINSQKKKGSVRRSKQGNEFPFAFLFFLASSIFCKIVDYNIKF